MTAARTLPVTPAERACATVLRTVMAWQDTPNNLSGEVDIAEWHHHYKALVKWGDDLQALDYLDSRLDLTPTGAALLARVEAAERTPETVLRAMLASYEAAALLAGREWARTASEDAWGPISVHDMAGAISLIRLALAWLLESRPDPIGRFFSRALATDYEARLAGTRPLDAPPMEAP